MPKGSTRKSGADSAGGTRKRKPSASVAENWYKVLGVRSNATAKSIKLAYIAKVKEFPPERHPEEFQKIRAAYDVLRDPVKRSEYDFTRKYGDSLDTILQSAEKAIDQGKHKQAEELFDKALEIAPDHIGAMIGMANVRLFMGRLDLFERQWAGIDRLAATDEEQVSSGIMKVHVLMDHEEVEEALAHMRRMDERYKRLRKFYAYLYAQVLDQSGLDEEAWKLMEETETFLSGELPDVILMFYIQWTKSMLFLEKKQYWSKVKQRFRAFLRSLTAPEDKQMAVESLLDEAGFYSERRAYKEASIFADLAYFIDPKHPDVLAQRREVQEGTRLTQEIERLVRDPHMFPAVPMKAMELFAQRLGIDEAFPDTLDLIPPDLLEEMGGAEAASRFIAEGIRKLRTKYPLVYKAFQEEWDALYEENASGLSQEQRRRVR